MELRGYKIFIIAVLTVFLSFVIWSYVKEYKEKAIIRSKYKAATIIGIIFTSLTLSTMVVRLFITMLGSK